MKKKWIIVAVVVVVILGLYGIKQANAPVEQISTTSPNPLTEAELNVIDVMNGTGDKKIGERAEIEISKETLKTVTQEQYAEFCQNVVKDSGYNAVTIRCDDGTGIVFAGSMSALSEYGEINDDGEISSQIGMITVQDDGTYLYEEY